MNLFKQRIWDTVTKGTIIQEGCSLYAFIINLSIITGMVCLDFWNKRSSGVSVLLFFCSAYIYKTIQHLHNFPYWQRILGIKYPNKRKNHLLGYSSLPRLLKKVVLGVSVLQFYCFAYKNKESAQYISLATYMGYKHHLLWFSIACLMRTG